MRKQKNTPYDQNVPSYIPGIESYTQYFNFGGPTEPINIPDATRTNINIPKNLEENFVEPNNALNFLPVTANLPPEKSNNLDQSFNYKGCVAGMCNDMYKISGKDYESFRKLNNIYGNAWDIHDNVYGVELDLNSDLKKGDIITLTRDKFKSDDERGIPSENQHIGYISKVENGVPYVKHYIDGKYYEEPINNISQKFKYTPSKAKRPDFNLDVDKSESSFKFDENYKPLKQETQFLEASKKNKPFIQETLKLDGETYDELERIAYGIIGAESSFGASKRTYYRMATPDFVQSLVKQIKSDNYDPITNPLSKGYSSIKSSNLFSISDDRDIEELKNIQKKVGANVDGVFGPETKSKIKEWNSNNPDDIIDYKSLQEKLDTSDYSDLSRNTNYLYHAFNQLGINSETLENIENTHKATIATLAWYKKRNPDATEEDLLKAFTGKKDISKYKEKYERYKNNINDVSDDNIEHGLTDKILSNLSNIANIENDLLKAVKSEIVGMIRDKSPLPITVNAILADIAGSKKEITEKSLSPYTMGALKQIVQRSLEEGKTYLDYNSYFPELSREERLSISGGYSNDDIKSKVKRLLSPAGLLQNFLGQAEIKDLGNGKYEIIDTYDFNDQGKSFGVIDDIKKRGPDPYSLFRSLGRNYGSQNNQGAKVRILVDLNKKFKYGGMKNKYMFGGIAHGAAKALGANDDIANIAGLAGTGAGMFLNPMSGIGGAQYAMDLAGLGNPTNTFAYGGSTGMWPPQWLGNLFSRKNQESVTPGVPGGIDFSSGLSGSCEQGNLKAKKSKVAKTPNFNPNKKQHGRRLVPLTPEPTPEPVPNSTGRFANPRFLQFGGSTNKYNEGGQLMAMQGPSHEQGGINIGNNNEVEGGEVMTSDFVFTNEFGPKGSKKTYAQLADEIRKEQEKRPGDDLSQKTVEQKLQKLAEMQESDPNVQKARQEQEMLQQQEMMGAEAMGGDMMTDPSMMQPGMEEPQMGLPAMDMMQQGMFDDQGGMFKYGGKKYNTGGNVPPVEWAEDSGPFMADWMQNPVFQHSGANTDFLSMDPFGRTKSQFTQGTPDKEPFLQQPQETTADLLARLGSQEIDAYQEPSVKSSPQQLNELASPNYSKAGYLANNIGPAAQGLYAAFGPRDNTSFERMSPALLDLEPARQDLRRQGALSGANMRRGAGNQRTIGANMAMTTAGNVGINRGIGSGLLQSYGQERMFNAQAENRANQINASIAMQEQIARQQDQANRRNIGFAALSNMGQNIAAKHSEQNMLKASDYRDERLMNTLASMYNDYTVLPDGTIQYRRS